MRSLTWQQLVAVGCLLVAVIIAHKFGGADVGVVSSTVGVIIAAIFIRPGDGGNIPPLAVLLLGLACIIPAEPGCKALNAVDAADVAKTAAQLKECQDEGRDAGRDGGYLVYEACKKEAGIQ